MPGVTIRMVNLESATQVQCTTFQNMCLHCLECHLLCYVLADITALPCPSLVHCLAGEGTSKLPNKIKHLISCIEIPPYGYLINTLTLYSYDHFVSDSWPNAHVQPAHTYIILYNNFNTLLTWPIETSFVHGYAFSD